MVITSLFSIRYSVILLFSLSFRLSLDCSMPQNKKFSYTLILIVLMAGAIIFLFLQNRNLQSQKSELLSYAEQKDLALDSMSRTGIILTMSNILDKADEEVNADPKRNLSDE